MEHRTDIARLFCPGPTYVPERIRQAMARPIVHHRSPEFKAMLSQTRERLKRLWQAEGWEPIIFTSSGSGAMEGGVVNFMRRDAKALNVSAGKFGERWAKILRAYGCEAIELKLEWGKSVDPSEVLKILDKHPDIRAVYLTSADTSTGGLHNIAALGPAIRSKTDALIVVDAICDFGGADIRPVDWEVDVLVSCSQKCLTLPPGLGLATISPRAWKFYETSDLPRFYFDWKKELEKERDEQLTSYTAAVTLISGLLESTTMLEEEGLANVVKRYDRTAHAVRSAVLALGLEIFPQLPSSALTTIRCRPDVDGTKIVGHLQKHHGYRIANGQDELKGKTFRIGHMGQLQPSDIIGLVHVIERTLIELGLFKGSPGTAVLAAEKAYAETAR